FQEEHLRYHEVVQLIFYVGRQEDDPLLEEPGEDIERPLAAGRLLDHHRNQSHRTSPCHADSVPQGAIIARSIRKSRVRVSMREIRSRSRSPFRSSMDRTAGAGRWLDRASRSTS